MKWRWVCYYYGTALVQYQKQAFILASLLLQTILCLVRVRKQLVTTLISHVTGRHRASYMTLPMVMHSS